MLNLIKVTLDTAPATRGGRRIFRSGNNQACHRSLIPEPTQRNRGTHRSLLKSVSLMAGILLMIPTRYKAIREVQLVAMDPCKLELS